MTVSELVEYPELIQGSEEWLEARRGILTASVVGKFITPTLKVASNETTRALTRLLVAERITGRIVPTFTSDAMMRGHLDEPIAREHYSEHNAPASELGFMVRTMSDGSRLGYSPDGLVGDVGLIEVKSAEPKIHLKRVIEGFIEHDHMAQMQAGLFVSGRKWCDYISWCGGLPMWVMRVEPNPAWFEAIEAAHAAFEVAAQQMHDDYTAAVEGLPATEYIEHFPEIEI